jgi:hypothetical protein
VEQPAVTAAARVNGTSRREAMGERFIDVPP